jgi:hypothetical protein
VRPHCRQSASSRARREKRARSEPTANAHLPHPFQADRLRSPSPRVLARFTHRDAGRRWPAGRMRGSSRQSSRRRVSDERPVFPPLCPPWPLCEKKTPSRIDRFSATTFSFFHTEATEATEGWTRLNTFPSCSQGTLKGRAPHPPCRAPSPRASIRMLAERGARGNALPVWRKEDHSCVPTVGSRRAAARAARNAHLPHPFQADRTRSPSPRVRPVSPIATRGEGGRQAG